MEKRAGIAARIVLVDPLSGREDVVSTQRCLAEVSQ